MIDRDRMELVVLSQIKYCLIAFSRVEVNFISFCSNSNTFYSHVSGSFRAIDYYMAFAMS
jgi:hypothetical protein